MAKNTQNDELGVKIGLGLLGNLDKIVEAIAFGGLFLTYHQLERGNVKLALPQAAIDFMLLKSRTEVGTGAVVAHLGIRSLLEYATSDFTKEQALDRMNLTSRVQLGFP